MLIRFLVNESLPIGLEESETYVGVRSDENLKNVVLSIVPQIVHTKALTKGFPSTSNLLPRAEANPWGRNVSPE